jgi:hypothetical protein
LHRRGNDWTEALTGNYLKMRIAGHWDANQWLNARVSAHPNQTAVRSPSEFAAAAAMPLRAAYES